MNFRNLLIASSLIAAMAAGIPSPARATTVFTDAGAFASAVSGTTTYSFPFSDYVLNYLLGTSYTLGPATFTASALAGYRDAYNAPYLGAFGDLSVTTSATAIGFNFGSYDGPQTITYNAGGATGTFAVPEPEITAFLGFTGLSGPLTLTFSNSDELDTTQVIAEMPPGAVPEPAIWAMMLLGFGAVGFAMRRRKSLADGKSVRSAFA